MECTTRAMNLYCEVGLNVFKRKGGFLTLLLDKRKSFLDRKKRDFKTRLSLRQR